MKKQNRVKKFLTGVLVLTTVCIVTPTNTKAATKPEKTVVESVRAFISEDEDTRGLEYTWKTVKSAKGYQYRYHLFWSSESTSKDFTKGFTKETSVQIGFQDSAKVCFQVRAYRLNAKGKKLFGKWSSKKLLKPEDTETLFESLSFGEYEFSEAHKKDLALYDSVYSTLKPSQYYAFADINAEFDALLVADEVSKNEDGSMTATKASVYGFNQKNEIVEFGSISLSDADFPLAVNHGCLYYGGEHIIKKGYADRASASLLIQEEAKEEFDSNGTASYVYIGEDGSEEKQTDNSEWNRLLAEREDAVILNFFPVHH